MKKPLILVVNDDGIFAPGIAALIDAVSALGEVVVVAPDSPQSGKGHALTIHDPIRLNKDRKTFPTIEAYECTGTPVDCVKLAKHVLMKNRTIDLCVSGINHGFNHSINILYSGTMSAAMEASLEGIPSVGFSFYDFSFDANFSPCKSFITDICAFMLNNSAKKPTLLNVNFPKTNNGTFKGVKVCRQTEARWQEEFQEGRDPSGRPYYWLTGKFINLEKGNTETDVWALENGYVSVVPSFHDLTDYSGIKQLHEAGFENLINQ
jgi:5'-nucleotidase